MAAVSSIYTIRNTASGAKGLQCSTGRNRNVCKWLALCLSFPERHQYSKEPSEPSCILFVGHYTLIYVHKNCHLRPTLALVQDCLWRDRIRDACCSENCGFIPRAPYLLILTKRTQENTEPMTAFSEINLDIDFSPIGAGHISTPIPPVQGFAVRRWSHTFWKGFIITI